LKESANFERTQNIRQALQEKYSLSRSSSLGTLHRSQGKNQDSDHSMRRMSILHPNALRRQVSPRLPKYASSGTFGCTLKVLERNKSIEISVDYESEPGEVADEL